MMYILTPDEYHSLVNRPHLNISKEQLQELCTKICDTMPIKLSWCELVQPWGCILTPVPGDYENYCDECPVQTICPNEWKRYSK